MFPTPGPMEMVVIMMVAVLLFGKRLPEVGRSLGKGIIEFKKGLQGIDEDTPATSSRSLAKTTSYHSNDPYFTSDDPYNSSTPKFEPPTASALSNPESADPYEPQPSDD